jgi:hypothetical protein
MRQVHVVRYVTPLREGGSLPAIVEADDLGQYVLKFRGAGQGPKALIAEVLAGHFAAALGLRVPERVFATLDAQLAMTEPDPEIQDLIRASAGLNFGIDYLPGSATFDPAVDPVTPELASRIVWFDAFVSNVDRTARNSNMLVWHEDLWLIDHGAALYFHHNWEGDPGAAASRFPMVRDHVLLPQASQLREVDAPARERIAATLREAVALLPEDWLVPGALGTPDALRAAYIAYFERRLQERGFLEEALDARG